MQGRPNGNSAENWCRRPTNTDALIDDDKLQKLLYDKFKPKFSGLEKEHLDLAMTKIRDRAATPPGSLSFWFIAVEKFLLDYAWEHRANERSFDLDREARVGHGPSPTKTDGQVWRELNQKHRAANS